MTDPRPGAEFTPNTVTSTPQTTAGTTAKRAPAGPVSGRALSAGASVLARTPRTSDAALAAALAHAFLAADTWTQTFLCSSAASMLGARRRWLGPLVREVLIVYPRRPSGSSRQLAAIILQCAPFQAAVEAAHHRGTPINIVHHICAPLAACRPDGQQDERVLPGSDLAELSALLELTAGELDWFADTKAWNRRATPGPLHHYRYEWRARPGRVPRLLEVPQRRIRGVQRVILARILGALPTHDAAHGFVPGRSALTGARQHTGAEVVIALDLVTFFARVSAKNVYALLRRAGYSESVAHCLTGLCTNAVPVRVLRMMPPGGTSEARFALRRALATPHLPQGAPTSPMLGNLSVQKLDSRLVGWAGASAATYTRYADDLAFSGDVRLRGRADAFVRGVHRIVRSEGHQVNALKTRVRPRSVRQTVTGIVVNDRTNVTRADLDRLTATLHNCVLHGPMSQNRAQHTDFRAHLLGRIVWVESLNPARGTRLRAELARIRW